MWPGDIASQLAAAANIITPMGEGVLCEGKIVNCRNQAITRFDRWSMSDMAMFHQLT
jgi:hypothetical protein